MMKKIYLFWIPVLCLLWRCSENERMVWESKAGVYFPEYTTDMDSLVYSFRISGTESDTIWMQVKLQGVILEQPKAYEVVVDEASTAISDIHFKALEENYVFPAHEATTSFPIVVLKHGKDLDDKTVTLALRLKATEDLDVALPGQARARLLITNQLIRPSYWDMPISLYFGAYSQAKHLKCIEIMGHDFPLKESELMGYNGISSYTYWMRMGRVVCNYYATHTEYDENNNLIAPWEPF